VHPRESRNDNSGGIAVVQGEIDPIDFEGQHRIGVKNLIGLQPSLRKGTMFF
jgi:hypothetical protein